VNRPGIRGGFILCGKDGAHGVEQGSGSGMAKNDRERIAELEREKELRRAKEILKSAAAFFWAELDRRPKR
jgi:transposase-like protein